MVNNVTRLTQNAQSVVDRNDDKAAVAGQHAAVVHVAGVPLV